MIKPEEAAFYALAKCNREQGISIRDTINSPECPAHYKRCWRWLEKWDGRGWYDWGVTMDLGWFTDQAPAALPERSTP